MEFSETLVRGYTLGLQMASQAVHSMWTYNVSLPERMLVENTKESEL